VAFSRTGFSKKFLCPAEVEILLGDRSKAKEKLGRTPKTTFGELVAEMVREDLKSAECDEHVKPLGYKTVYCRE
jgi:GDPmannose 4,6-dehydratase